MLVHTGLTVHSRTGLCVPQKVSGMFKRVISRFKHVSNPFDCSVGLLVLGLRMMLDCTGLIVHICVARVLQYTCHKFQQRTDLSFVRLIRLVAG